MVHLKADKNRRCHLHTISKQKTQAEDIIIFTTCGNQLLDIFCQKIVHPLLNAQLCDLTPPLCPDSFVLIRN